MASTIVAGNTTNGGTAVSSDNTGILEIKTGSGAGTTALTLDTSQNATAAGNLVASAFTSASTFGFKNRLMNGGMIIDQRNAGASVTQTTASLYGVDRFQAIGAVTTKFTFQRSSTAPTGFINSTLITSSSAYTVQATDFFMYSQFIEGLNISDLAWGTASAASVTLSFWVRSSLTGAFGGVIQNSDNTRNYPFTYTINTANTFEYKTVTIPGDTSGTWLTTNGIGMKVRWSMGAGSTVSGPAGSWSTTLYYSVTGATSLVGTNGATLLITGTQLEKGSTATSFEYRDYGRELQMCQRYFQWTPFSLGFSAAAGGTFLQVLVPFQVQMRVVPSFATLTADPNTAQLVSNSSVNIFGATYSTVNAGLASLTAGATGSCQVLGYRSATSAEL